MDMNVVSDVLFYSWICIVVATIVFMVFNRKIRDRFGISPRVSYAIVLLGLLSSGITTALFHEAVRA